VEFNYKIARGLMPDITLCERFSVNVRASGGTASGSTKRDQSPRPRQRGDLGHRRDPVLPEQLGRSYASIPHKVRPAGLTARP
jgi:hypothetical protein